MEMIYERGLCLIVIVILRINFFRPGFAPEEGDLFVSEIICNYFCIRTVGRICTNFQSGTSPAVSRPLRVYTCNSSEEWHVLTRAH